MFHLIIAITFLMELMRPSQGFWGTGEQGHLFQGSDFIWYFGKLPFPADLGKYILKNGKISTKIHEIGKIKTIFGLGMTPI